MKILPLLAIAALAGCGAPADDVRDARETAAEFVQAHHAQDGERACELIAPETRLQVEKQEQQPCEQAVLAAELPELGSVSRTQVFIGEAVVVTDEQAVFLSWFDPEGWRVTAAGCTARGEKPHDCEVEGA